MLLNVDGWVVATLVPLATYLALSGIDDLLVDLVWLAIWVKVRLAGRPMFAVPSEADLTIPEKRIAIFVPLWHESEVIGSMLAHNIAAIRYSDYAFFVGVYP